MMRTTRTMRRARFGRRGFTLMEMITAVSLLLVIAVLSFQIVQIAAELTTVGRAKVQAMRNAHAAMSILKRDLEGAVFTVSRFHHLKRFRTACSLV